MSISRLLVSVLLVNLYLYCYTSGEAVKESELVAAEKELEKLAVEDADREMEKDDAIAVTKEDKAEENTLIANDVGDKETIDKKDTQYMDELLDMSITQMMNDILSKKASEDPASCTDERRDCELLKRYKYCESHKEKMKIYCKKTCNICPKPKSTKCQDAVKGRCKLLVKWKFCQSPKYKIKMQKICAKSCGYCRMPSPPKCSTATNGCCWDKSTPKQDKMGTNCRACKDSFKTLCTTFKDDCFSARGSGTFMKLNCPVTCKMCGDQQACFDDPNQSAFCPTWAKEGGCKSMAETMKVYCRKSCGLC